MSSVAFAFLAVPPGFPKLEEVLRNLGSRRKKCTEIGSDLCHLVKGIVKFPRMNIHELADKLPCSLIGRLSLPRSGASKVGS